ncbi:MAG: carbamate kinase [Halobacteriales archaeon]|jgi:carbamate kinase
MSSMVVALGGNALLRGGEGTIEDQRRSIRKTAPHIGDLYENGHDLVFTHGNGPQVGQLLLQNEESTSVSAKPMDVLGAESQAQIGYLLQRELHNVLDVTPVTTVTQTRVDAADPAFDDPTKPVGPFYDEDEAAEKDFQVKQVSTNDGGTAYRRVVPSPDPIEIVESERIGTLIDTGQPVVCVGGGGAPVVKENGDYRGVEAVIDKDRATQVLANNIEADDLLLLTDVEAAYRNFGTDDQERIAELTPQEARDLLDADEFGEGSMAPKVEACAEFIENGGERAIITSTETATEALTGDAGTIIK